MITWEDIRTANEATTPIDIKGKDYVEVNKRVKAFRMVYPEGFIIPDSIQIADGVCTMTVKCGYIDDNGIEHIIAKGTAQEKESASFINKTSYIENCETSAVGRCLGFAGFGIDSSICSKEEYENAKLNQTKPTDEKASNASKASNTVTVSNFGELEKEMNAITATPVQVKKLKELYTGDLLDKLLEANNITQIEDLPLTKATALLKKWQEKEKKQNAGNNN